MKKFSLALVASAGLVAGLVPVAGAAAPTGPVTVTKDAVVIDTGIRCVTEPCPSYVVVPLPTAW